MRMRPHRQRKHGGSLSGIDKVSQIVFVPYTLNFDRLLQETQRQLQELSSFSAGNYSGNDYKRVKRRPGGGAPHMFGIT